MSPRPYHEPRDEPREPGHPQPSAPRPSGLGAWHVETRGSEILAVHAALLSTGRVLYFSGSQHDDEAASKAATRLWDPSAPELSRVSQAPSPTPLVDLFCCGHA